jgi:Tol biopolymer transport system component
VKRAADLKARAMTGARNKTVAGGTIDPHFILGVALLLVAGGLAFWVEGRSQDTGSLLHALPCESRVRVQQEKARADPHGLFAAGSQDAGTYARASEGDFSFIVTQIPVKEKLKAPAVAGGMLRAAYGEGARILRVTPNQGRKVLSAGFASAADPDVSFDGQRILFSGKKLATDNWQIFEMKADGSETRQVTKDPGDCRGPTYQSKLNTLVAEKPWYQITFVSTAAGELNEFAPILSTNLYSSKLDGTFVSRLTFNPSSSFDPFLNDDGRLIFAMWQRSRLDRGEPGRIGLFELHQDGTDLVLLCADQGRRVKHMPTVTTDGWVVFVETDEVGWDGGGSLGAVSLRRRLTSYRQITRPADGLFHSPSPLPDGKILVSRRAVGETRNYGVYRLDPNTGRYDLVFDDPAYHDIQAKVLEPRVEPDGRSSSVFVATGDIDDPTSKQSFIPNNPRGKLYCLNAYISDLDRSQWLASGTIKRVRVLEGLPRHIADASSYFPEGMAIGASGAGSTRAGIPPILPRRFLGEVPIEEDGSFNVEVPADIPIEVQLLDENGMALRSCGWIWVKNNEPRGCIGCHEDQELTPENRMVDAVKKLSIPLTLPPERRRAVGFRRDIMPIIEAKCTSCHGPAHQLRLDGGMELVNHGGHAYFNRAYESLLAAFESRGESQTALGRYVHAGRARTSPLVWHLFGFNTSRSWDLRAGGISKIKPMPPEGLAALTDDERRAFVEWIDTGALWDVSAAERLQPAHKRASGGR